MSLIAFSVGITLPIFIVLITGTLLKRVNIIDDHFIAKASRLSFNVALPALLFVSILKSDIDVHTGIDLTVYGLIATTVLFFILELVLPLFVSEKTDRGVVVQGAYRSNLGIVGLAYCLNAYGDEVVGVASMYLAFNTILYNILGVITLTRWSDNKEQQSKLSATLVTSVIKNPLVVSIVAALCIKFAGLSLPNLLVQTGAYFAQLALPLALLCAGASLSFKNRSNNAMTALASVIRLCIFPALITLGGALYGFRGMELGTLFLMTSAPAAAASYIMARAMGGNADLAGNIIAVTTLFSIVTTGVGAALLRHLGLS